MSELPSELNEVLPQNEWGGYEHLMSEKSKALLQENGLTYRLGTTRDSIAISSPFSVAVVPGLMPFTETYFAPSAHADYRYITKENLAETIADTVKNVLASEGLDDSNTLWWPIYVYDSKEVEGDKIYTADTSLLPLEGAQFAGVAYRPKENSWGENRGFGHNRVPLSIKQRDFSITRPRKMKRTGLQFGLGRERKGMLVQSSVALNKQQELDAFNLLERQLRNVQMSVNYGLLNLFIERDGQHASDKGDIKRTDEALDKVVEEIVTRLNNRPANKLKAEAVTAEVECLISDENKEILSKDGLTLDITQQKHEWFIGNPWQIVGDRKLIPISWKNEYTDLSGVQDNSESIHAVLTGLGFVANEFYCFPIYSNKTCSHERYFYTTADKCTDQDSAKFVGFAYIHKTDYEVTNSETGETDHSKSVEHEAALKHSLDEQLSMISLYKHDLIVDISLWRGDEYIGYIPYVEKDEGSVNGAIDSLLHKEWLTRSLMS